MRNKLHACRFPVGCHAVATQVVGIMVGSESVMTAATLVSESGRRRRTDPRVLVVVALVVAGAVATALTAWACARSPILVHPTTTALWRSAFVASYVTVGSYTWWRRPETRLGPLVAGVGLLYGVASMNASAASLVYTLGMVVWAAVLVYLAYVYLCFPRGQLESQLERGFSVAFALSTALVWGLILALSPTLPQGGSFTDCGTRCPHNALQIVSGHAEIGVALNVAFSIVFTIALIAQAMLIFHKARSPAYLRRREVAPLAVAFLANIVEFVIALFVAPTYPGTRDAFRIADGVVTLAVPVAILVGQVRGNLFAAKGLGQLAVRAGGTALTPAAVQKVIGDALGDSTLRLALWSHDRAGYVDVHGGPLKLSTDARARGVTRVARNGRPLAALIHDPTLDTDSDLVEGLAATSLMLLENARLVDELHASRARIVATAQRERLRLERNLHDGAQQRLMGIQVKLRMAQQHAASQELAAELEAIRVDAMEAVEDLRVLAQGIYPTVLRDLGLADALRGRAMRAPIPINVSDEGIGRCSASIEEAIYFCALEAVQNTIKHAGPHARVTINLERHTREVHFVISDNGIGMDTRSPADGTGLTSMRDRIGAVGGELEISSSPGHGVSVRGSVPDDGWGSARERSQESQ
jgi:signal transduction histidine kinase/membrane protein DedA with SNARE-associated domain